MDLRTDSPYWLMKNGFVYSYPSLNHSVKTEVAIIGGGITGALIAYHLTQAGISTVVLDKRKIGMGSTCASTALLQYEIDTPLNQLQFLVGEKNANRSYLLCVEAIKKIESITKTLQEDVGFENKQSFYYASRKKDLDELEKELELRQKIGIEVEFWTQEKIEKHFSFSAPGALMSSSGAQIDAYRFTHELFQWAKARQCQVFDDTTVEEIVHHKNGVRLMTEHGHTVDAKKLIIACGYESQNYLTKKIVDFNSSFAVVSEPVLMEDIWYHNCLIWETARPYLYIRTTSDSRILIGGKDEPFYSPTKRDALNKRKAAQLEDAFKRKFPNIPFRVDFKWAGTFAETADGLPYIGKVKEHPHTYFAMGFGGNGIVFSLLAAEIIRDELEGKKNADASIFKFDR
ncbi:MAG: NAD(P)/FAD-dependent oxidoreductase [Runella zeae]